MRAASPPRCASGWPSAGSRCPTDVRVGGRVADLRRRRHPVAAHPYPDADHGGGRGAATVPTPFYVRYSTRDYSRPDAGHPRPLTDDWWSSSRSRVHPRNGPPRLRERRRGVHRPRQPHVPVLRQPVRRVRPPAALVVGAADPAGHVGQPPVRAGRRGLRRHRRQDLRVLRAAVRALLDRRLHQGRRPLPGADHVVLGQRRQRHRPHRAGRRGAGRRRAHVPVLRATSTSATPGTAYGRGRRRLPARARRARPRAALREPRRRRSTARSTPPSPTSAPSTCSAAGSWHAVSDTAVPPLRPARHGRLRVPRGRRRCSSRRATAGTATAPSRARGLSRTPVRPRTLRTVPPEFRTGSTPSCTASTATPTCSRARRASTSRWSARTRSPRSGVGRATPIVRRQRRRRRVRRARRPDLPVPRRPVRRLRQPRSAPPTPRSRARRARSPTGPG